MNVPGQNPAPQGSDGRGMVCAEANFDQPSQEEKMARRRFQAPKPQKIGNWWYLLYWQDEFSEGDRTRKRKRVKLAPASMLAREVEKIAAETLRPLNQGLVP